MKCQRCGKIIDMMDKENTFDHCGKCVRILQK